MSDYKRLRGRQSGGVSQAVEIKEKRSMRNPDSDRVPQQVWAMLQRGGEMAARHLLDMLEAGAFKTLPNKDKMRLIDLALTRAYGKADPGVKRSVQVQLSASGNDAVTASLERLAGSVTLPEHSARDVSPETTRSSETPPKASS